MSGQVRLAQIFDVSGYAPTRASLYLKRVGENEASYFDLSGGSASIDACNFSSITQRINKITFADTDASFTGEGYLEVEDSITSSVDSWPMVTYPILTETPQGYFIYMRGKPNGGSWNAVCYIDGERVGEVDETGLANDWQWFSLVVGLPDKESHNLSLELKVRGSSLDKLYIIEVDAYGSETPTGEGPALTDSPYITLHLRLYDTDGDLAPSSPLAIYDWKTTISEVITDDWYNFDLSMLTGSFTGDGNYALVLASSGGSTDNFVLWELMDNDEYTALPSAIRT